MKKNICTIFLLIGLVNFSNAQVKSVKLLNNRIAKIHLIYEKSIDLEKGDTLYMVFMGFQNARYSSITDIKSIALFDIETVNEFLKDLLNAKKQMELGEKITMAWDRAHYQLQLHDFTKDLSFGDKDGRGYTWLNINNLNKLISTLNRFKFGSDQILPETK